MKNESCTTIPSPLTHHWLLSSDLVPKMCKSALHPQKMLLCVNTENMGTNDSTCGTDVPTGQCVTQHTEKLTHKKLKSLWLEITAHLPDSLYTSLDDGKLSLAQDNCMHGKHFWNAKEVKMTVAHFLDFKDKAFLFRQYRQIVAGWKHRYSKNILPSSHTHKHRKNNGMRCRQPLQGLPSHQYSSTAWHSRVRGWLIYSWANYYISQPWTLEPSTIHKPATDTGISWN